MNFFTKVEQERKLLKKIISRTLELSQNYRCSAQIAVNKTIGINISTRYGRLENIEFNNDGMLSITVYKNSRKGNVCSNDLSLSNLEHTLQVAIDISNYASSDPFIYLPEAALLAYQAPNLDLYHPWMSDNIINNAIKLASCTEQTALQADKKIVTTEGGSFSSTVNIKLFGNTHGMLQSYCSSYYVLAAGVIAKQNNDMERDYSYSVSRIFNNLQDPQTIGMECANRTLAKLSSRKLSTRKAPVIFSSEIAGSLFSHLGEAISGNNVYQKSTFLINSLNKRIFPSWLNIQENPHILQGLGSAPFDGEGVLTKKRNIIQDGILQTWLLSSYSARKLSLQSTGHAGGIYNWLIHGKGGNSQKELLSKMNNGLLVTELLGEGVNIITGNYSRGVAGFWVANGQIKYPVNEITISGNLKDMWLNILALGDDIETRSNIQCGSVLIAEINIAGS